MKNGFLVGLLLLASTRAGVAQVAGGAGGSRGSYGGSSSMYANNSDPAQIERAKRQPTAAELKEDNTATYIEGSVLMNVPADEYVAVFGVLQEGKTPEEATTQIDATIAKFKAALQPLGIKDSDLFVDFIIQNRVYAYRLEEKPVATADAGPNAKPSKVPLQGANRGGNQANANGENFGFGVPLTETTAIEELVGFELKKNVSIHFKDRLLVDSLVAAAANAQIYDLIKVDYIVKDLAAIQSRLHTQTMGLIKQKFERYQTLLGVELSPPTQVVADKPGLYFPVEQYDSYTAAESERIEPAYDRSRLTIKNARKSRTTYFNPLSGNGFDTVINPVIIEPVVQVTTYIKVKCEPRNGRRK